jgi:hypothetical protein
MQFDLPTCGSAFEDSFTLACQLVQHMVDCSLCLRAMFVTDFQKRFGAEYLFGVEGI